MVNYSLHKCLCGFLGDSQHKCTCAPQQVQRYRAKISGPLLDRIDIQIEVPAVKYKELSQHTPSEDSAAIRVRVNRARESQLKRLAGRTIFCNAQMSSRDIRKFCHLDGAGEKLLENAMARLGLSAAHIPGFSKLRGLSPTLPEKKKWQARIWPRRFSIEL